MHRAMEEDSLMIRHDDECHNNIDNLVRSSSVGQLQLILTLYNRKSVKQQAKYYGLIPFI